jgi:hypothetical protein
LHFALIHENWYKWINIQYVQTQKFDVVLLNCSQT